MTRSHTSSVGAPAPHANHDATLRLLPTERRPPGRIALALYMEVSYGEVLRCLLEGLGWLGLPVKSIRTVQKSSINLGCA